MPATTATASIILAIVPVFASCQYPKISICERTTAIKPQAHQKEFLIQNKQATKTSNKAVRSQIRPIGLETARLNFS